MGSRVWVWLMVTWVNRVCLNKVLLWLVHECKKKKILVGLNSKNYNKPHLFLCFSPHKKTYPFYLFFFLRFDHFISLFISLKKKRNLFKLKAFSYISKLNLPNRIVNHAFSHCI